MEHRWGKRFSVNAVVRLHVHSKIVATGHIVDASLSGAFVRTEATLGASGHVVVELPGSEVGRKRKQRVAAYIVRVTSEGIGLEWCEFAPSAIITLLARQQDLPDLQRPTAAGDPSIDLR